MCETLDSWEEVMYINMYGCNHFGYTYGPRPELELLRFSCTSPKALGWVSALFFITLVVFGGLVLPAVLIGLVSVVYEKTTNGLQAKMLVDIQCSEVMRSAQGWFPNMDLQRAARELRELFSMLDYTDAGFLDYADAKPFLVHMINLYLSEHVSEDQTDLMFSAILDVNGDQHINFAEFLWFIFMVYHRQKLTGDGSTNQKNIPDINPEANHITVGDTDDRLIQATVNGRERKTSRALDVGAFQQQLALLHAEENRDNDSYYQRSIERNQQIRKIHADLRETVIPGERRLSVALDSALMGPTIDRRRSLPPALPNRDEAGVMQQKRQKRGRSKTLVVPTQVAPDADNPA